MLKKIKEYKPLTRFLKKNWASMVSIDFGQAITKIAYLESLKNGTFKLLEYDFQKILASHEKRKELNIEFINNFLKKNSVSSKDVVFTISDSDSVIIKYLVLPPLPESEMLEAAAWEIKEEIPFKLLDALSDWQVVREYTDPEGAIKRGVTFIFANKEIIYKYIAIIQSCNLNPVAITATPFNYSGILAYYPQNTGNIAVLDIGYKDTALCIYNNSKLVFIRKLAFSAQKLTQSLTGALVSAKGKIELSGDQAEDIKNTFGIPQDVNQIIKDNIQAGQVISLMRPVLEALARDIALSFDYFASNFNTERPPFLYIAGGSAHLKNLDIYLNRELNISVAKLPLPQCVDAQTVNKERLDNSRGYIISALGAALAYGRTINLLPQEIRTQKMELVEKISLRVVSIVTAVIFLFLLLIVKLQIRDYETRLKTKRQHLQGIQSNAVLKQNVQFREQLLAAILRNKVPADGLLKLLSALVPNSVILNDLSLEQRGERGVLTLRGRVSTSETFAESILTKFIEQLEASSFVSLARLVSLSTEGSAQAFQIDCQLVR